MPTRIPRETLTLLRPRLDDNALPILIFVNKGIEIATKCLTLEILADTCGAEVAKVAIFIVSASNQRHIPEMLHVMVACSLARHSRKKVSHIEYDSPVAMLIAAINALWRKCASFQYSHPKTANIRVSRVNVTSARREGLRSLPPTVVSVVRPIQKMKHMCTPVDLRVIVTLATIRLASSSPAR